MPLAPTVTVLMSVFNGEKFLREAIDSILEQTYSDFEFVIYDDSSEDRTNEIIQSYDDSRIRYIRNVENKGLTYNLADGINRSKAKYIVRMDADDIAFPERIEYQVAWMDLHSDISIMGTSVSYFKEVPGDGGIALQPTGDSEIKAKLFIDFTLLHPTIILRRESLQKRGINYNTEYRYSQDHALYFDCIKAGLRFANIRTPLLYMRAHEKSISRFRHGPQLDCSKRARLSFLQNTGIISGLTDDEVAVYNSFASGEFPETPTKVALYERFVEKVCRNQATGNYFDSRLLFGMMVSKLITESYHAAGKKGLKSAAWKGFNTRLFGHNQVFQLKDKLKFIIKLLLQK